MAPDIENGRKRAAVLKTVFIYVLIGAAWIVLSDRLVESITPATWSQTLIQTAKGILYVFATATLLYLVLDRELGRWQQAESKLRKSEQKYRQLFSKARVGIVVHNSEGAIVAANALAQEYLGLSQTELQEVGLDYWEGRLLDESWNEISIKDFPVSRVLETGSTQSERLLGISTPGTEETGWFLVSATAVSDDDERVHSAIVTFNEVSERKRMEEELESSGRFLQATLDALPSNIAVLDEEGTIILVNESWRRFGDENGLRSDDYGVGTNYVELIEESTGDRLEKTDEALSYLRALLADETQEFRLEYPCHSAHEERWFLMAATSFHTEGWKRILIAHIDITERKLAEKRLRDAEEKYRLLAENTLDCIWQISLPDLRFTYINPAIEEMTGYSREEWMGSRLPEHCDSDHWERLSKLIKKEVARPSREDGVRFETKILRKDGDSIDVEILGRVLFDANGRPYALQGTTRDITERKQAEEALRKSETILAEAEKLAHVGGWEWDIEKNRFILSDEWRRTHGWPGAELSLEELLPIAHPEDIPSIKKALQDALDGVRPYDIEHRIIRQDNDEERYIKAYGEVIRDETGEPVRMYGTAKDITERRRTEEALRLRERAIDSSINGIALTDMDGTVIYVNPAALEMWQLEKESEVVGRRAGEFWNSRDEARGALAITKEEGGWEGELTAKRQDGSTFPVRVSMSLVEDEDGVANHVLGVFLDVSREKEAYRELKQTNQRLENALEELHETQQQVVHQERQRALTQMASGIAHDFNNALSTIQGFSDLLLQSRDKLTDEETAKRYVELIYKAASNAAETVRRMRKFYRPGEEVTARKFDLRSLVEEAVSMTRPRWRDEARAEGAAVEVVEDLCDGTWMEGNEAEMYEVVTNLIFNAVDAMPEGGTITLKTRHDGDSVILEVSDTGVGMDEQVREHCLDPFFTTKKGDGSGLGLSTVQGVIRRHGGSITVESEVGQGTTFRISLPATDGAAAGNNEDGAADQLRDGLQVLLLEDTEEQRELITEYLELDGHEVQVASDGADGLAEFADSPYDLVITDRAMPEVGGDEVARKIKQEDPDKPVIMLTGFGEVMDAPDEMPEGVDFVLSKPVTLEEVRRAISRVMSKKRDWRSSGSCSDA